MPVLKNRLKLIIKTQMHKHNNFACPTTHTNNDPDNQLAFKPGKQPKHIMELAKDPNGINDSTMSSVLQG